jgi:hypothetical protein
MAVVGVASDLGSIIAQVVGWKGHRQPGIDTRQEPKANSGYDDRQTYESNPPLLKEKVQSPQR